jgi:tRNA (cytidine/uridine-2'-O-)-methyltransferase
VFHIILYQPEIPPNTGNIIRLCANTGVKLHLIQPLGFTLDDKSLKRAGLDYHQLTFLKIYSNLEDCLTSLHPSRVFALSAKGHTTYTHPQFQANDAFLFGPETRGLPKSVLQSFPINQQLRIPQHTHDRSLNLSNSAAIVIYEAWRQMEFSLTS